MSHQEMEPPDRITPRALHAKCFARWTSRISEECPICKEDLSDEKVNMQKVSPYDLHHRVCEGQCIDYFSILSCKALGDDMSFLADEQGKGSGSGPFQPEQTKDPVEALFQENIPSENMHSEEETIPDMEKIFNIIRKSKAQQPPQSPPPQQPKKQWQPPQNQPNPNSQYPYQDPAELEEYRISQEEMDYYINNNRNRDNDTDDDFNAEMDFMKRKGLSGGIFKLNWQINLTPDFNQRASLIAEQNRAIKKYVDFCNQPIERSIKHFDKNGNEVLPDGHGSGGNYRGKPVVRVPKRG